ncbi:MAG TPA: hypothetical protein VJ874_03040 [Candidatus Thermoplasmatota archaeon]|nr:hypothetical protein [Candidatus Thermoplasmatota archaeon]
MAMATAGDSWTMAKGYPVLPETQVLPECAACGSRRFRDEGPVLRCEDCHARQVDPFEP